MENNCNKKLIIELEVGNDIDAYQAVSNLAFEYKVVSAKLDEYKEEFDEENLPFHFLKNNKNNKKVFRDIQKERFLNVTKS